jgi:hypothetical protein
VDVLVIPFATPFVLLLLHACLQRALPRAPHQRVAMLAGATGFVPALFAARACGHDLTTLAYVAIGYPCIAYSYFHVFNLSETARRIRLIRQIDLADGMKEAELRSAYSEDEVVDTRLERMAGMGHLVAQGGRYFVGSPTLLFAARVLDAWQVVLGYRKRRKA